MEEKKSSRNLFVPMAVVGLIVIVIIGIFMFQAGQDTKRAVIMSEPTSAPVVSIETSKADTSDKKMSNYKDGKYAAVGNYTSPGGAEELGVSVTLKDGVIVSSDISTEKAQRPNSIKFQGIFKASYKPFVEGKNIDEVKLDKVSASSLSPKGFNDALEKIKQEARV